MKYHLLYAIQHCMTTCVLEMKGICYNCEETELLICERTFVKVKLYKAYVVGI